MKRGWTYIVLESNKPVIVTLLNVLAPEMLGFEKLGTIRDLAAIL